MVATIAQEMKKLTDDMLAANETRLQAVGALVAQTRATLKDFGADRSKRAADQAKDLADFVGALSQRVQEIRHAAQNRLGEFEQTNRQMSKEQAKRLADYMQSLVGEVKSMLSRFGQERAHLSHELGERLDHEIGAIKAAVEQILKDAAHALSEQHAGMLEARQAWQAMCAAIGQARTAGFPTAAAGEGPVAEPPQRVSRKGRGKKAAKR